MEEMDEFPIYFSDLTKECQARLLEFVGAESASDMNWDMDILPLAEYPKPEDPNPEQDSRENEQVSMV